MLEDERRRVRQERAIAGERAGEEVVDDHRRDRRDEADRGGEQRLGDARRDDGEIGRVGLADADEGVHDAPDGAEQADEGRRRADRGEDAGAAGRLRAARASIRPRRDGDPLLDALCREAARALPLRLGRLGERRDRPAPAAARCARRRARLRGSRARSSSRTPRRARRLAKATSRPFDTSTVQVTSEAKARPSITAFTTQSAARNMPSGDRSCGSFALRSSEATGEAGAGPAPPGRGVCGCFGGLDRRRAGGRD